MDDNALDLKSAAVWPDCARSYYVDEKGQAHKKEHDRFESHACRRFDGAEAVAELSEYASVNNDNYLYSGKHRDCHKAFHFSDLSIVHDTYKDNEVGTNGNDVVHTINAAIAVLQDKPAPAPYHINSKRKALYLLAHMMGDLHQPLHVVGVYLDSQGAIVDPASAQMELQTSTHGGNSIQVSSSENLHHLWDETNFLDHQDLLTQMTNDALDVCPTKGSMETWAITWANQSIRTAQAAFATLTFDKDDTSEKWTVQFIDRRKYGIHARAIQQEEVTLAGARLVQVLVMLYPNN